MSFEEISELLEGSGGLVKLLEEVLRLLAQLVAQSDEIPKALGRLAGGGERGVQIGGQRLHLGVEVGDQGLEAGCRCVDLRHRITQVR